MEKFVNKGVWIMEKSKLTVYIIYYTDKHNDDEAYEVYGYNNLLSAIKWLHSDKVKARKIHIYKRGKDFENNQDDVIEVHRKFWK